MNPQIVDIFNFDEKTLADTTSWEISLFHQCLGNQGIWHDKRIVPNVMGMESILVSVFMPTGI